MKTAYWRLAAFACVLACGVTAISAWSLRPGTVQTEDGNRDGRPDLWRFYDASGELRRAQADTNFDGSSDTDEYYDRGVIARRVVDVDFDGRADVLVLFRDGQPAVTTWASDLPSRADRVNVALPAPGPDGDRTLAPMFDPFRETTAFRSLPARAPLNTAMLSSGAGLPVSAVRAARDADTSIVGLTASTSSVTRASSPSVTRGPPPAPLI